MADELTNTPAPPKEVQQDEEADKQAALDHQEIADHDLQETPRGTANAEVTGMREASGEPLSHEPATNSTGHVRSQSDDQGTNTAPTDGPKTGRRKSGPPGGVKKKLGKKGARVKTLHIDAKPGDYFFVKLKGYPTWPVIVCSEDMLPQQLLKTRPVSAAHPDGSYRHDFADGGKRVSDRSFPVMYLQTNEFGWVCNQDLHHLDPGIVMDQVNEKMRRDLQEAYALAAEQHPLNHFKDLLVRFEQEKQELAASRVGAAGVKRSKKPKVSGPSQGDATMTNETEGDIDNPKSRKRKANDQGLPTRRHESTKKPKIKLTSTQKPPNLDSKESGSNVSKMPEGVGGEGREYREGPKEPSLTPEEKYIRREKEVLFYRHKLQRGLLTRDHAPKEGDMISMSEYLAKLEGLPDLEVGIIKKTKINKVLKAILKLEVIPKDAEYSFKSRSHKMLDKWNKLLASDAAENIVPDSGLDGNAPNTAPAAANGTGDSRDPDGSVDAAGVKTVGDSGSFNAGQIPAKSQSTKV